MRATLADVDAVARVLVGTGHPDTAWALLSIKEVFLLMPHKDVLFVCVPSGNASIEVHSHVMPGYRGKQAIRDSKAAISWAFENMEVLEIHGFTPECFPEAKAFNSLVGFKKTGVIPLSFIGDDGEIYDQVVYSITRGSWFPITQGVKSSKG